MKLTQKQKEAFEKFENLKVGALFMKQGSGKTLVALELIKTTDADFVLFVCPFSTKANLEEEINKWVLNTPYEIIGYETLSSSDKTYLRILELLKTKKKTFIVADESVFIKNNSKRSQRMLALRDFSEYRLILNGTPITKNEWDIYNQMLFLSPKIINMDREEFKSTFFKKIEWKRCGRLSKTWYEFSEVNAGYLHKLVEPYIFYADLDFKFKTREECIKISSSDETYEEYQNKKEQFLEAITYGDDTCIHLFQSMAVTCFSDIKRHREIAYKLRDYGQIIVFCTLLSEVENISSQIDCYTITGDTPTTERTNRLKMFEHDSKPLLMTLGTGAFGLNLQYCNKIAFASLSFDYAKIDQAMSRIKRLGQKRDINYTYFTSDLGIYDMIIKNIDKKETLKQLITRKIKKGTNFEKIL